MKCIAKGKVALRVSNREATEKVMDEGFSYIGKSVWKRLNEQAGNEAGKRKNKVEVSG